MKVIARNALILSAFFVVGAEVGNSEAPKYVWKELKCLADNVYHEARGEPFIGQVAVAKVTLNRVHSKHYPQTICEVVYQNKQFSWTSNKTKKVTDYIAYQKAWKAVWYAYNTNFSATHYHATYVNPNWGLRKIAKIGNHIFYK